MQIFKGLVNRFTAKKRFFYGWEEREFEQRREQQWSSTQIACRFYKY